MSTETPTHQSLSNRYSAIAVGFHWIIAGLFIAVFAIAFYMDDLPLGPEKFKVYGLHKSVGVTILVLSIFRLIWRFLSPPPPLPAQMTGWERTAAHGGHIGLYVLMIGQPLLGIAHSQAANFPVVVWGLVEIPKLVPSGEALKDALVMGHLILGMGGLALIIIHIAASVRHHFVQRDDILVRMVPGLRQRGSKT